MARQASLTQSHFVNKLRCAAGVPPRNYYCDDPDPVIITCEWESRATAEHATATARLTKGTTLSIPWTKKCMDDMMETLQTDSKASYDSDS